MARKNLLKLITIAISLILYLTACNEVNLTGDEIAWSPDGKYMAFINVQTQKIFISRAKESDAELILVDEKIHPTQSLQWSESGDYLMYLKSQDDNLGVWVYNMATRSSSFLGNIASKKVDKTLRPTFLPQWEPDGEKILAVKKANNGNLQLIVTSPKNNFRKTIFECQCARIAAKWDRQSKAVYFSVHGAADNRKNGIWTLNLNRLNPDHIFHADNLAEISISQQGAQIAFSRLGISSDTKLNGVFIANMNCKNPKKIFETDQEIEKIEWSPDGQKLACVVTKDKKKNIFLIDVEAKKAIKLTFDNVLQYFGWKRSGNLFFTISYPEPLVELSGLRADEKEFSELNEAKKIEHQLICFNEKGFKKIGQNMIAYQENPDGSSHAFYKILKINILGDNVFLPTLMDSTGNLTFFAETAEQNIAATDEFLAKKQYENAFPHLNKYWGMDIRTNDLTKLLDIKTIFNSDKKDSLHIAQLTDAMIQGAFVRTIIALQGAGLNNTANTFLDGFANFSDQYFRQTGQKYDEMIWALITPYSRLHEFDRGISAIDQIMKLASFDSLSNSYLFFAQAIFLYKKSDYPMCIKKLLQSAQLLPVHKDEVEPYNMLLSFCLKNSNFKRISKTDELFSTLINRFPNGKGIEITYELMGDWFEKNMDKTSALNAFQKALILNPNESRLWQKIFNLEKRQ